MTSAVRHLRVAVVLLALTACATTPGTPGSSSGGGSRNLLTRQQLTEQHFENAYDAVSALRTNWLQARGPDSFNTPSQVWVYMDATKLGDVTTLKAVSIRDIQSIEHLDGPAAQARYGVGHGAGAIVISTFVNKPREP